MSHDHLPDNLFTSRPAPEQMKVKYPLLRCPPHGLGPCTIVSHDVIGADTHFAMGRTRPCPGPAKCEICEEGQQPRWRGYLFVLGKQGQLGVIELTPAAMVAIDKHFRRSRTLRGSKIRLARRNGKANGELWAEITPAPATPIQLPKAPSMKKFLATIWQMQPTAAANTETQPPRVYPRDDGPDFGDAEVA